MADNKGTGAGLSISWVMMGVCAFGVLVGAIYLVAEAQGTDPAEPQARRSRLGKRPRLRSPRRPIPPPMRKAARSIVRPKVGKGIKAAGIKRPKGKIPRVKGLTHARPSGIRPALAASRYRPARSGNRLSPEDLASRRRKRRERQIERLERRITTLGQRIDKYKNEGTRPERQISRMEQSLQRMKRRLERLKEQFSRDK